MLPKRIWFLWLQGLDQAPLLVRRCLDSWQHWNPNWQIDTLDQSRVDDLLPELAGWRERWPGMTPTSLSDLIRIKLLSRWGGVWVDATCLCRKPLDVWLPYLAQQGFFAFANPAPDRLIASWFLAAEPEDLLISTWRDESVRYWDTHRNRQLADIPELTSSPEFAAHLASPLLWFDQARPESRTRFPYFWFHYLFAKTLLAPEMAARWHAVPKLTADIPHRLQRIGLDSAVDEPFVREFQQGLAPLYKLDYRTRADIRNPELVLGHILSASNW